MNIKTNPADLRWWFWTVTLLFIVAAVAGWTPGYGIVIAISLAQERSVSAFPTQIRIVYFAFTLFGLWPEPRRAVYLLLLIGTIMVTFFGRCAIALVLKRVPWNRGREVRLN